MKTLIYLATATLVFASQGAAFAQTNTLDDVDFKQIVCSSLKQSNNKVQAMTDVLSMTQTVITPNQRQTLKKLASNKISSQNYCKNVKV